MLFYRIFFFLERLLFSYFFPGCRVVIAKRSSTRGRRGSFACKTFVDSKYNSFVSNEMAIVTDICYESDVLTFLCRSSREPDGGLTGNLFLKKEKPAAKLSD